jgi:hypothetical protein
MEAASPAPGLAASSLASARARRTTAFRATVDLVAARLGRTSAGRLAKVVAAVVAVGMFGVAVVLRAEDGPGAQVGGLLRGAAAAIAWLSGGALAMAAARDAEAADRAEGIEALVAARGVGAGLLRGARTLGATAQIARSVGVPLAVLALGTAALAGDVPSALRRVAAALALLAWGGVAGVTLAAFAAASVRLFGKRGPTALVLFVLGERAVAEALGAAAWSVPGALNAALGLLLGVTGVGGGA